MAGKITGFFREFVLPFSIILTILGTILCIIGISGVLPIDSLKDIISKDEDFWRWSIYLLIVGFIVLVTGVYYLYSFIQNRKFLLEEMQTNKRSEIIKRHADLKNAVRKMPSKYQKMLKDKEIELKIK